MGQGTDAALAAEEARDRPRRADARWIRGRRLVVVDIENVVGGRCDTTAKVRWARRRIVDALRLANQDQVVVGVDAGGLIWVGTEWCGPRHVLGRGESGADKALLEVLGEDVADRFDEVVLVSGDGIFTDIVAELTRHGVVVTVVAHETALNAKLRLAATRVLLLRRREQRTSTGVPGPRSVASTPCAQPA